MSEGRTDKEIRQVHISKNNLSKQYNVSNNAATKQYNQIGDIHVELHLHVHQENVQGGEDSDELSRQKLRLMSMVTLLGFQSIIYENGAVPASANDWIEFIMNADMQDIASCYRAAKQLCQERSIYIEEVSSYEVKRPEDQ